MARMGNFVAGDPALARATSALAQAIFGNPAAEGRMMSGAAQFHAGLAQADRADAAAAIDRERLERRQAVTTDVARAALGGDPGAAAAIFASLIGAGDNAEQGMAGLRTGAGTMVAMRPGQDGQLADTNIRQGAAIGGRPIGLNDGVSAAEVVGAQDAAYRRTIDERRLQEEGATTRNRDSIAGRQRLQDTENVSVGAGGRVALSPTHVLHGSTRGGSVYGPATKSTVEGAALSQVLAGRGSPVAQALFGPKPAAPEGPRFTPIPAGGLLVTSPDGTERIVPPVERPAQAGAGAAGAARATLDVSPQDVAGLERLIVGRVPAGFTMPTAQLDDILTRASSYYQSGRNSAEAVDLAFREVMGAQPRTAGNWSPAANQFLPTQGHTPPPRAVAPQGAAAAVMAPPAAPAPAAPAPAAAPPRPAAAALPPAAAASLREGEVTTFRNGQRWTLVNGQPAQVQ